MVARFFCDTEFVIHNGFPHLLSIGIAPEDDEQPNFYATRDLREAEAIGSFGDAFPISLLAERDSFVAEHVLPTLHQDGDGEPATLERIGELVTSYIRDIAAGDTVQLWGDTPAYDHVALASCFGGGAFRTYPDGILPYGTFDVEQEIARVGLPESLRITSKVPHRALDDAVATRNQFSLCQVYDVLSRMAGADRCVSIVDACAESAPYRQHLKKAGTVGDADLLMRMVAPIVQNLPGVAEMGDLRDTFEAFVQAWAPGSALCGDNRFDRAVTACHLATSRDAVQFLATSGVRAMFANTWGISDCSCHSDE